MFIADQGVIAVADSPTMTLVQAVSGQQLDANKLHVIGVCLPVPWNYGATGPNYDSGQILIAPLIGAGSYFGYHHPDIAIDWDTAKVRLIRPPKHGKLMWNDEKNSEFTAEIKDWRYTQYFSDAYYTGNDSLIMEVKILGYTILVHYFLSVDSYTNSNPGCKSKKIGVWEISAVSVPVSAASHLLTSSGLQIDGYALNQVGVSWSGAIISDERVSEIADGSTTAGGDGDGEN